MFSFIKIGDMGRHDTCIKHSLNTSASMGGYTNDSRCTNRQSCDHRICRYNTSFILDTPKCLEVVITLGTIVVKWIHRLNRPDLNPRTNLLSRAELG